MAKGLSEQMKEDRRQHEDQGMCRYYIGGMGGESFCLNTYGGEDHYCAEHQGMNCGLCSRQATNTLWEYGTFAYAHPRCDEHQGMWELPAYEYLLCDPDPLTAWQNDRPAAKSVPRTLKERVSDLAGLAIMPIAIPMALILILLPAKRQPLYSPIPRKKRLYPTPRKNRQG